jgi:hypothetical protein
MWGRWPGNTPANPEIIPVAALYERRIGPNRVEHRRSCLCAQRAFSRLSLCSRKTGRNACLAHRLGRLCSGRGEDFLVVTVLVSSRVRSEGGVQSDEQFSHDGSEGQFGWFAGGKETLVKRGQDMIATSGR